MKIEVAWTPLELEHAGVSDRVAVVVDVLRAATSIVTAIHHAARAVLPAESIESALRIANSIGRRDVVLCGERGGARIEGFDLGNSPAEFTAAAVGERTVVMTTTNGTRALLAASGARLVYVASLANLSAVARRLGELESDTLIVCAGRDGRVSADDALCAGLLVDRVITGRESAVKASLGDGAIAALALSHRHAESAADFFRRTAAGRALQGLGQDADIDRCARLDACPEVPVFRDGQITRVESALSPGAVGTTKVGKMDDGRSGG